MRHDCTCVSGKLRLFVIVFEPSAADVRAFAFCRLGASLRVLLIEDDGMIGRGLVDALAREGMATDWVRDGHDGAETLATGGHAVNRRDLGTPTVLMISGD